MAAEKELTVLEQLIAEAINKKVFHHAFSGILADQMDDVCGVSTSEEAHEVLNKIHPILKPIVNMMSDKAREQLFDDSVTDISIAYRAGMVSIADAFLSQRAHRLPEKAFYEFMDSFTSEKILETMYGNELPSIQIAVRMSASEIAVRQTLRRMTGLGIADYRSNGREYCYFLTPAAKAYHEHRNKK